MSFTVNCWPLDLNLPSLLFIHGAGQSSIFWEAQLKRLSSFVNTVAIDLPGHGFSIEPGASKIESYVEFVLKSLNNTISLPSPISICGLSMGGAIVQQVMLTKPTLFKSAVLINTGARLKVLPEIISMAETNYKQYLKTFTEFAIAKRNQNEILIRKVKNCCNASPETTANDFKACNKFDVMKKINKINIPTLVLASTEDKLTPVKYGLYLSKKISKSKYIEINKAGHMSPIERPGLVTSSIKNFLLSLN